MWARVLRDFLYIEFVNLSRKLHAYGIINISQCMLPVYLYDSPTSVSDRAPIYFVEFCPGLSLRYHDGEPGYLTFLDENNTKHDW